MTKKEKIITKDWTYKGEVKNGKPHGRGTLFSNYRKNSDEKDEFNTILEPEKYVGEFKNGLQDGKGILTYENGYKYEGSFKKGLRHGYGAVKDPVGNIFIDSLMGIPQEGEYYEDEFIG
jgi:hypothetical protein